MSNRIKNSRFIKISTAMCASILLSLIILSTTNINASTCFADSQNVKPGIVIGRIQKDIDDYSFMAQYRERYKWSS